MRALVVDPDAPEAVRLSDVAYPVARDGVLVEVRHASLNRGDLNDARSGRVPPGSVLGSDVAGVVLWGGSLAPGTRVVGALFDTVGDGITAGEISHSDVAVGQPLSSDFIRLREEFDFVGDDSAIAKCFLLWAGLVGAISLEVFGQYGHDTLTEPAAVFDIQVRLLIDMLTA